MNKLIISLLPKSTLIPLVFPLVQSNSTRVCEPPIEVPFKTGFVCLTTLLIVVLPRVKFITH